MTHLSDQPLNQQSTQVRAFAHISRHKDAARAIRVCRQDLIREDDHRGVLLPVPSRETCSHKRAGPIPMEEPPVVCRNGAVCHDATLHVPHQRVHGGHP